MSRVPDNNVAPYLSGHYPVHADLKDQNVSVDYDSLIKSLLQQQKQQLDKHAPPSQTEFLPVASSSKLQQRGGIFTKESDVIDFEGRTASKKEVFKVNPTHPLGIVRDLSKTIRCGRDLPSTNNITAYPKNLLPNHCIMKIIACEVINFDYDKELCTQFIMKPIINSDGVTWLQSAKPFSNYLGDELPWEFKIGMSKIYRNLIIGDEKRSVSDQAKEERWDPTGWYLYINPFANRNEKMNTYKNHVSLSFAFLSAELDMKNILEQQDIYEPFSDLNEAHLCHAMNFVSTESDKFLMNNYNAVKLYNYRQVEEVNGTAKYKNARGKRIGDKKLMPYSKRVNAVETSPILRKRRNVGGKFTKLLNSRIIDDSVEVDMIINEDIEKNENENDDIDDENDVTIVENEHDNDDISQE